jgi:hypothetical protein
MGVMVSDVIPWKQTSGLLVTTATALAAQDMWGEVGGGFTRKAPAQAELRPTCAGAFPLRLRRAPRKSNVRVG